MPSISTNNTGGVVRWDGDDWLRGLVPWHRSSGSNLTQASGLTAASIIDPWRRPGYIMPGTIATDFTTVAVVDGVLKGAIAEVEEVYAVGGSKIHNFDSDTETFTNAGVWPHSVTAHGGHGSASLTDIVKYSIGSTRYGFYSWSDTTDGDVGRYDLSTTFDDDWLSTVPAGAATLDTTEDHPMVVGDDDILYIADGRSIHGLDGQTGANGTLTKDIIQVPQDFTITSFAKIKNFLVVFAYIKPGSSVSTVYKGDARAYFWDYVSEDFTYVYPLNSNFVGGGFSFKNTIGCFVRGAASNLTHSLSRRMMLFDGAGFEPVVQFEDTIPSHNGVMVVDGTVYWNSGGKMYRYGAPYIGATASLNHIATGGGTTSGLLDNFNTTNFVMSSGTGAAGGCESFTSGFNTASSFEVPLVNIPFRQLMKSRVTYIKAYYGAVAANGNKFKLFLETDRGSTSTQLFTDGITAVTASELVSVYKHDKDGNPFPNADSVGFQVSYASNNTSNVPPYLQALEIYFEYIKA